MKKKKTSKLYFVCLAMALGGLLQSSNLSAQNDVKKSVSLKVVTVNELIKKLGEVFPYSFFISDEKASGVIVSVDIKNATIEQVLSQAFEGKNLAYTKKDKSVVISYKTAVIPQGDSNEKKTLSGIVVDDKGEAVIGASVTVKGTSTGTVTDIAGKFSLSVDPRAVLVVSYIGYKMLEVAIENKTNLAITLIEDVRALDEVIVIGYGTALRKDYTGSVSSVKLENSALANLPNMNVLESLKGNVAGLNIGATNTAGGDPSMLIRGQNSISGTNDPLIILDGVIYLGNIGDINPNDIAGIDVLKDAVSAAAYGSRSANGVIAITTRKGRSDKPVITFNASTALQTWPRKPDLIDGESFIAIRNEVDGNPPGTISWLREGELRNYRAGKETNWLNDVVRTGSIQDYRVTVSGMAPKVNYYLSTSYESNRGVILGDDFNRISLFGKIDAGITDWLNVGINARYARRDYSGLAADLGGALSGPIFGSKYYDDQGHLEKTPMQPGGSNPLWNPLSGSIDNKDIRQNLLLNAYAVVRIPWIEGLSYRMNYLPNIDRVNQSNFYYELNYVPEGPNADRYTPAALQSLLSKANGSITNAETSSYVLDNILTYAKTFGKHSIEGTLVATRDESTYKIVNNTGSDFSANGNTLLGIDGLHKAKVQKIDIDGTRKANVGYLGRINYAYDGKYYFIGSYRRDGASVFGANRKWGNFAGASVAWRISEEPFMKGIEPLNNLKLKFNRGQNGNQGIKPYTTLSQVSNGPSGGFRYEFSDTGEKIYYGLVQSTLGNYNLGWESTDAYNIGFESAWLKNRLFVDVDFYHTQTFDQIFNRTIPSMTGFSNIYASMGQVNNTGVDLTVRSVNIDHNDWTWTSGLVVWKNNNKLVHLYGDDLDGNGKEDDDIANSLFIGNSLGAIYGYKQDGIVQEDDTEYIKLTGATPGSPKYKDMDGVPGINADDRVILGYGKENFRLSLSNNVRYKAFELYVLVAGVFGGNNHYLARNQGAYISNVVNGSGGALIYRPYWTSANPSDTYPNPKFVSDGRFLGLQSRSFLRIQDISLSYSFDEASWVKSARINSLKVYLAIKNLATFTDWFGVDPETGGTYGNNFPVPTTCSLGLNLSF